MSQAQFLDLAQEPEQTVAALFAVQSMQFARAGEATRILLSEPFAGHTFISLAHDGIVNAVAFSPDGRYAASGSGDRGASMWEVLTGREIARMNHRSMVSCYKEKAWHKKKANVVKRTSVRVGNLSNVSGNVNIAGGNIRTTQPSQA